MSDIINFENKKYQWENINGQRCLVPYIDKFPYETMKVGDKFHHNKVGNTELWEVYCINGKYNIYGGIVDFAKPGYLNVAFGAHEKLSSLNELIKYLKDNWRSWAECLVKVN